MNHCVDCNCKIGGHGQKRCKECQILHFRELRKLRRHLDTITKLGSRNTHKPKYGHLHKAEKKQLKQIVRGKNKKLPLNKFPVTNEGNLKKYAYAEATDIPAHQIPTYSTVVREKDRLKFDHTLVTLAEWLKPLPQVSKKVYELREIYWSWRNGYGKS